MANIAVLLLLLLSTVYTICMAAYNVVDFGAKPDGRTDASKPFLNAWLAACNSTRSATMYVPAGKFLVSEVLFKGPCNGPMKVVIAGTIFAPWGYSSVTRWVTFKYIDGLSISGGIFDGQGQAIWACKTAGKRCPYGATSITIGQSKNVVMRSSSLVNSEMFHMAILASDGVTVTGCKFTAPGNSPNTDGIHVQMSSHVNIIRSNFATGDDCISMGPGTTDVWIEGIKCGPGHGISIGSLGGGDTDEPGVRNVTVRNVVFTGTQNGVRVKTWGKRNAGFVSGVRFEHVVMQNVQNPIVVDQNYCPGKNNCPGQDSGIKISEVIYNDVKGSSATPVAVKFDCSPSNPCDRIRLQDIELTYQNKPAQSFCKHVKGSASGLVVPRSCL